MDLIDSAYHIRPAQTSDLPMLSEIERAASVLFRDTPYAFLAEAETLSLEFVQQQFQAGRVWVAVTSDNQIVGYAIASEVDKTIYLQQIDVHPSHGRRGIGSQLVKTVCVWAKLHGYPMVTLSTFRDIPWNAPFYAKLGFRPIDESKLSRPFQEIRIKESEAGLPISERVIMKYQC